MHKISKMAEAAKIAKKDINKLSSDQKNKVLLTVATELLNQEPAIIKANELDVTAAMKANKDAAFIDRLVLNKERIKNMATALKLLVAEKDPVNQLIEERTLYNGLKLQKFTEPFGVIGIIYESRPNVTIDTAALCFKAGSATLLKGGSDAINSNKKLTEIFQQCVPVKNAVQLIPTQNRNDIHILLQEVENIDLIIPRGGAGLINFVRNNSRIPIIETGTGNCHIFVDKAANLEKALKIIENAKTQRPSVCNAVETVLIHQEIAGKILPDLKFLLDKKQVVIYGCEETIKIISCEKADETSWTTEFLALKLAIRVVKNTPEAISHINKYGSKHSESIISENIANIEKFMNEVDAAVVYTNASTRFTDGGEFGLGAEIGISTQKCHARGPMGLTSLTTTKYKIFGDGQIRN